MTAPPFWSEHDAERMAYAAWLFDHEEGLTDQSWERAQAMYRLRAAFQVQYLNDGPVTAA